MKPLIFSVRMLLAIPVLLGAALVYAQAQPTIKGLTVTTVTLEHKPYNKPQQREATITLLNNTDKTIVGYTLVYTQLDGEGKQVGGDLASVEDFLTPDGSQASHYILPGQPITVRPTGTNDPHVVSLKVTVAVVLYLDGTYESATLQRTDGSIDLADSSIDNRKTIVKQIRDRLAGGNLSPEEKAKLERDAAFFENALANMKQVQ